jgi:hypothetical protein
MPQIIHVICTNEVVPTSNFQLTLPLNLESSQYLVIMM